MFTSIDLPFSWLIAGLIVGGGFVALFWWLRSKDISVKWYEWLLGALGLILILLTIQNIFAAIAENEAQASLWYFLLLGLPGLILVAVAAQLANMRYRRAS